MDEPAKVSPMAACCQDAAGRRFVSLCLGSCTFASHKMWAHKSYSQAMQTRLHRTGIMSRHLQLGTGPLGCVTICSICATFVKRSASACSDLNGSNLTSFMYPRSGAPHRCQVIVITGRVTAYSMPSSMHMLSCIHTAAGRLLLSISMQLQANMSPLTAGDRSVDCGVGVDRKPILPSATFCCTGSSTCSYLGSTSQFGDNAWNKSDCEPRVKLGICEMDSEPRNRLQGAFDNLIMSVQVNSDPFSGGWMFKAKLSDSGDLDKLLDSGAYEKHCESAGDH